MYFFVQCYPEKKLKGLVVWITGASSGIGEELAYQLAKCGSLLVLSARREDELNRVKRSCLGEDYFFMCFVGLILLVLLKMHWNM